MLLKAWFSLIVSILLAALSVALYSFNPADILSWSILVVLIVTLMLTILVYLEQPHKSEVKKVQKMYIDFIKQKDRQIEELQGKNKLLFRTSVKHSEETLSLAELKRKLEEKEK